MEINGVHIALAVGLMPLVAPVPWLLYCVWLHHRGHCDAEERLARLLWAYRRPLWSRDEGRDR